MASLSRFKGVFRQTEAENDSPSQVVPPVISNEKNPTTSGTNDAILHDNGHDEPEVENPEKDLVPTEDAQRGVQQVEAVALTWTKPYLIAVFIL